MKHDWQSIPIPGALAERPRDNRGFPITFVTLITSDGRPDFTTIDGQKIIACIREGLCGMCGTSLFEGEMVADEPTAAFVGGPIAIENRNFLDPPMHEWCASYAMQVCPHIAIDTSRYSKPQLDDGEGRELFRGIHPDRPERFGMAVISVGLIGVTEYQGQPVFKLLDKPAEVRWQGEPQYDSDGRELVPYCETRHFVAEEHEDEDGEPCLEMTIVTNGRHRKEGKDFIASMCPGCNKLVKITHTSEED